MGCKYSQSVVVSQNTSITHLPHAITITKSSKSEEQNRNGSGNMWAVLIIQNFCRRCLARVALRKNLIWSIHRLLEYSDWDGIQSSEIERESYVSMNKIKLNDDCEPESNFISELDDNRIQFNFSNHSHLSDDDMNTTIKFFMKNKILTAQSFIDILQKCESIMKPLPNINTINSSKLTVIGDLHGSLSDLVTIFNTNGLPHCDNPVLFNGDFADRGPHSTEILALICLCLIRSLEYVDGSARSVYINRGNHEDHVVNERYGFFKELNRKYSKSEVDLIKEQLTKFYTKMPLASVYNEDVFIVHGGVSNTTDIEYIQTIDRTKFISVLCFQPETFTKEDISDWKQVLDLLWSDPRPKNGSYPNKVRGGGQYFGPDISLKFLLDNNWNLIVRSHECCTNGSEYTHDGRVLTVFSASDYYQSGSNVAAIVTLFNNNSDSNCEDNLIKTRVEITKLNAKQDLVKEISNKSLSNIELMSSLQKVKREISMKSDILLKHFNEISGTNDWVSMTSWCAVMSQDVCNQLPWRRLIDLFVMSESFHDEVWWCKTDSTINYRELIRMFCEQ